MKTIILLLLGFTSLAQVSAPEPMHCIPLSESRIIHEMAYRSIILDSLAGSQAKRIALDSVYKIELDMSYRAEIKDHNERYKSLGRELQDQRKLTESYKEEAKDLRRKNRWGKVKMWGVVILAGVVGYGIGNL